ncbi:hypothetical protein FM107_20385 [Sphingobacterium sp. JB170]|nr:hypothetical protein FM107_20385 [Sphingobacterium sp. JB170]
MTKITIIKTFYQFINMRSGIMAEIILVFFVVFENLKSERYLGD